MPRDYHIIPLRNHHSLNPLTLAVFVGFFDFGGPVGGPVGGLDGGLPDGGPDGGPVEALWWA